MTTTCRTIKTKSSQVTHLVPQVIDKAERLARDPSRSEGELQVSTQMWAGHVQQLVGATQQANLPWSKTASKVVKAARTGKDIRKQVRQSVQMILLVQLQLDSQP